MAQADNPAQPRSMTLMAGPIDTRVNPTKVNELAKSKSIDWFERHLIARVPQRYSGGGRLVYPGFVQLAAFMSMNIDRHLKAHRELYENLANGETVKAAQTKAFYDEYFAVLDLTAEFYLETVRLVFQEHTLPMGALTYQNRKVDPRAIRRTTLFTVEGEKDDICAVGQTLAAHDLCTSLRPYRKRHHMQAGVGHYGVFSGRSWQQQIYPMVKNNVLAERLSSFCLSPECSENCAHPLGAHVLRWGRVALIGEPRFTIDEGSRHDLARPIVEATLFAAPFLVGFDHDGRHAVRCFTATRG